METINYTPAAPAEKPKPYNIVTATWKSGFQHSFVSVGHVLNGHLKALEGLEYVIQVVHHEITKEVYENFYSMPLEDVEATVGKATADKKVGVKKGSLKFSSLENFFGEQNSVEQKVPARKSRRK